MLGGCWGALESGGFSGGVRVSRFILSHWPDPARSAAHTYTHNRISNHHRQPLGSSSTRPPSLSQPNQSNRDTRRRQQQPTPARYQRQPSNSRRSRAGAKKPTTHQNGGGARGGRGRHRRRHAHALPVQASGLGHDEAVRACVAASLEFLSLSGVFEFVWGGVGWGLGDGWMA